jgi:hypothetical protein
VLAFTAKLSLGMIPRPSLATGGGGDHQRDASSHIVTHDRPFHP